MYASNKIGGSSDPQKVKLKIDTNPLLKPQFKTDPPQIQRLKEGEPFFYDFQTNRDIYPEYEDAPYVIKMADGYDNPEWLRIENNKLISDMIPSGIGNVTQIHVVISNTPGGESDVYTLFLTKDN